MPYPLSHAFELAVDGTECAPLLDHLAAAAKNARMDLLERGASHLVVSSSFRKARYEETLAMSTVTRAELRVEESAGRRRLRVHARFGECAALGAALPLLPWLAALLIAPRNALKSFPLLLLCIPAVWLLLYLYAMLDVRVWTRNRVEELLTAKKA